MSLTLTTLRFPDAVPPQTRRVQGNALTIGRGAESDWVLPDPNRHLSKRHCTLRLAQGVWQVEDISTNGTFVNLDDAPVGRAAPRDLHDGDRLRLGMYELEVRISAEQPSASPEIDDDQDPNDDRTRVIRIPASVPTAFHATDEPDVFDTASPFNEQSMRVAAPTIPVAAQPIEIPEDWDSDPFDEPAPAPPAAPSAIPSPAPPPLELAAPDLMAAFLRGAGVRRAGPADAEATMEALGAAFRAVVEGVRQVLQARASIKSEFRIEQTMIRARGNNPLKFSAGDEDALASLIGLGRRTDMPAAEAVRDALRDMQLHELASMAAMQAAVRSLVAQFDPEKIRAGSEQGGMALVPAQRKARAWEAFEALHGRTTQALADDFDSVFGKAFAIAYERTLHEAAERVEPQ